MVTEIDIIELLYDETFGPKKTFVIYNGANGSVIGVFNIPVLAYLFYQFGDLPILWDVNDDNFLEIMHISNNRLFYIYTFEHLGRLYDYTAPYIDTYWYYKAENATQVIDIATGDINGDGWKDIVYSTPYYVYAINGRNGSLMWTANVTTRVSSSVLTTIVGIETAYISSTSRMDVVLVSSESQVIALQGNSSGVASILWIYNLTYSPYVFLGTYYNISDIKAAQLDNDVFNEIVLGGEYHGIKWVWTGWIWLAVPYTNTTVLYFDETGTLIDEFQDRSYQRVLSIDIANLTYDAYDDIVAITKDNITLTFDGTIRTSTLWTRTLTASVLSIAIYNIITSDTDDEIIFGLEDGTLLVIDDDTSSTAWSHTTRGKPVVVSVGAFFKGSSIKDRVAVVTDNGTVSIYHNVAGTEVLTYTTLSMINFNYINSTPNRMFSCDYNGDGIDELILINWNYVIAMNGSSFAWAYVPDTYITALTLDDIEVIGQNAPKNLIVGTANGRVYVASFYTTVSYQLNNPEITDLPNNTVRDQSSNNNWWIMSVMLGISIISLVLVSVFVFRKKKIYKI